MRILKELRRKKIYKITCVAAVNICTCLFACWCVLRFRFAHIHRNCLVYDLHFFI